MKKITLKISAFLLLTMFAFQVNAQQCPDVWTENGIYKISTCGLTPELFMTINGSTGALEWAAELTGDDPTQLWTITDHREPAGTGFMEVWATIPGVGDFAMAIDQSTIDPMDTSDNVFTLTVVPGQPIADTADPNYGFDQFQRRRTTGFGGPGNDALFVKPPAPQAGSSRYGTIPTAAGEAVEFTAGTIDPLRFVFVATLSNEDFDTSSIFISNPVNNELSINGLTDNVNQVSIYSLIGQEVISRKLTGQATLTLDVSDLTSGMYLVKLTGANGSFTKKIVKQ
ncbi:T9SS type A sorting domain-containing protein [Hyunsoonleella sp. 2307UL5-6]|uniref:T9SS type A sorting domain-containing protein n=1 Tax=Hyunsoonleella sp. 2307UL5-6 TaxID=3384768 RepID=UPI0039BD1D78